MNVRHAPDVVVSDTGGRLDRSMATRRSYGGRPHKGDRDAILIRTPLELGELVRDLAEEAGMSITDYVTAILARELDRPDLSPIIAPGDKNQKELPLAKSA